MHWHANHSFSLLFKILVISWRSILKMCFWWFLFTGIQTYQILATDVALLGWLLLNLASVQMLADVICPSVWWSQPPPNSVYHDMNQTNVNDTLGSVWLSLVRSVVHNVSMNPVCPISALCGCVLCHRCLSVYLGSLYQMLKTLRTKIKTYRNNDKTTTY